MGTNVLRVEKIIYIKQIYVSSGMRHWVKISRHFEFIKDKKVVSQDFKVNLKKIRQIGQLFQVVFSLE